MWNDAPENFTPNDAGGISFVVKCALLDAALNVDGIDEITAAHDDAKFTLSRVASGMTALNVIRSASGKLTVNVSDASSSIGPLSIIAEQKGMCAIIYTDPARPELNASSGYCAIEKHPDIKGSAETNVTPFVFICPILKMRTGGLSIVIAE